MKDFRWSDKKNEWLKKHRGISFEEIVAALAECGPIDILESTSAKYSGQSVLLVSLNSYLYVVPFSETASEIFLITAFPSRKMKKKYGVKP